jgi:hypothetical protein
MGCAQQNLQNWRTFWSIRQWMTILLLMNKGENCFTGSSQHKWRVVRPLCKIGSEAVQHRLIYNRSVSSCLLWPQHPLPHWRETSRLLAWHTAN